MKKRTLFVKPLIFFHKTLATSGRLRGFVFLTVSGFGIVFGKWFCFNIRLLPIKDNRKLLDAVDKATESLYSNHGRSE